MKTLTLDKSKWICGHPDTNPNKKNFLGKGSTSLLNTNNFMCCLGQFSLQLNKDLKEKDIKHKYNPSYINCKIPLLNVKVYNWWENTQLANKAMNINDDKDTTVEEKIKLLKKLFAKKGYKIIVKN